MAILNYTTKVSPEKTLYEIQNILRKAGASKVSVDYKDQIPVAVTFCLALNGNTTPFLLPCNFKGVLKAMQNDLKVSRSKATEERAQWVSWRILKDWIEAQLAIVEAHMAEMSEVFLPYAITKDGTTVYQAIKSGGMKLLNTSNNE